MANGHQPIDIARTAFEFFCIQICLLGFQFPDQVWFWIFDKKHHDYSGKEKSLEIQSDALDPSNRVLLIDEWIETATQVKAAISLIERLCAKVAAVLSIAIDDSPTIRELRESYPILSLSQDF
jgi:hypothetical protein